jgi:hypothetical protein
MASESEEWKDPVIEEYKKHVDRTLLRHNLSLTVEERLEQACRFHRAIDRWRGVLGRPADTEPPEERG